jgi:2-phospho-L-lactate guanylyltransferase
VTCWVVIPVKALSDCKTRLRSTLGDAERRAFVKCMLMNVLGAAQTSISVQNIALLGPDRHGAPPSVTLIPDAGLGLNAALRHAAEALTQTATRLVILPADLPRVTAADIDVLAKSQNAAIAPDRFGTGTNALSLPLPRASGFQFQLGLGSFERHRAEAARLGIPLEIVSSETLALDIDTPEDLATLRALHV